MLVTHATPRARRAGLLAIAVTAIATAAAAAALAAPPTASAALLGKPAGSPAPNCPRACSVLATVTGFQIRNQKHRNPFKARKGGRIVAWKVRMGNPNQDARQFFNGLFDTPNLTGPTAQISILHRVSRGRFRLVRQSPNVRLSAYYGNEATITLNRPLRVRKGQIVALTTRTWVPSFVSDNRVRNSTWRASRDRGKCGDNQARRARPHRRDGSIRQYRCAFGDRLLYWAYFTPSR